MGEVYLARDGDLNRTVAVKLLPADVTADAPRVARFEQEARAASALNHPNVCVIHALGRTADGRRFIAMEHVEGETLRERVLRGRLPLREALDVAIQIASALTAAHAAGIVHRDLKPENVMIRRDRLVKVLDFGLAKLAPPDAALAAQEATRTIHATEPGTLVGTTRYMAPEQARGGAVDARTDVWALGVVLYEMVTGRPPFTGATRSDVLVSILEREPKPLDEIDALLPRELQRIVGKALNKDPEERYQVMKDLLLDLKALQKDLQSSSASGDVVGTRGPASATKPRRAWAGAVALALVAIGAGVWWWTRPMQRPATDRAAVNRPLTRLTFGSGLQTDPTFSPDGRFIAYASDQAGNFDIWVQPITEGEARPITRSPAQETQPAWSPDGRRIVFRSERDGGGLFVVPAQGGAERQLTSFGVHPLWTADGSEILFHTGFSDSRTNVHIVSADGGGTPRELLQEFAREGYWNWMAPHPDGRISVIGVHAKHGFGFFTVSRDSRSVTSSKFAPDVPLGPGDQGTVVRFQWNGDGSALHIEAVVNEVRNLWKVRVEPTTLEWVSAERLTTGAGYDAASAVSPDGTRIAYTTQRRIVQLWTYAFDAAARRLADQGTPVTPEGVLVGGFDLSSDGRMVAYPLSRAGSSRSEMWTTNLETNRSEVIGEYAYRGAWSRDNRALAYPLFRPDRPAPGEWAAAVREIGGPERLFKRRSTEDVILPTHWTRDRRAVLGSYLMPLYAGVAKLALWRITTPPAATPERILLADPQHRLWQGRFSPDERWVSFVAQHTDNDRLQMGIIAAEGSRSGKWRPIVSEHHWGDKPRWAPDGRTLYFVSRQDTSFYNLWGVAFDPERGTTVGEPFRITHFDSPGFGISPELESMELGISARRAVLTMATVTGNIWMLENVDR